MASAPSSSNLEDEIDETPATRPKTSNGSAPESSNDQDNQSHYESVKIDLKHKYCEKNPGHAGFIRVADFTSKYLPALYRDDKDVVDLVTVTSDLTCYLLVRYISQARPEESYTFSEYRGQWCRTNGTGWVSFVELYREEEGLDCECEECRNPGTPQPKKTWGEVYVKTARHVVYHDEEAKSAIGHFFYNSPDMDTNTLPVVKLTGFKVRSANTNDDSCEMVCATHNIQLLEKLCKTYNLWSSLNTNVQERYSNNGAQPVQGAMGRSSDENNVCVIVSHPHGLSKHVTVGTWTKKSTTGADDRYVQQHSYEYSTPTCPGSSGAPVITLPKDGVRVLCWSNYPAHSKGWKSGPNICGGHPEAMLLPQD